MNIKEVTNAILEEIRLTTPADWYRLNDDALRLRNTPEGTDLTLVKLSPQLDWYVLVNGVHVRFSENNYSLNDKCFQMIQELEDAEVIPNAEKLVAFMRDRRK